MSRKIIVPVSYMGSGSSAITDLISEFEGVNNKCGTFEYVFLHCPNGVFDLEDKLLIGNNALRSDEALHTFYNTMKSLYDKKYWWVGNYKSNVGVDFLKCTKEFVNNLVDYELDNYWYYQENNNLKMLFKISLNKIIYYLSFKKIRLKKPLLYDKMLLSYVNQEKFYECSKNYLYNIFKIIDSKNDLLLDQLILPHNLNRVNKYFDDDARFIVVDRDPRDVFISNKYIWLKEGNPVPYSTDVNVFCEQYRKMRLIEKKNDDKKILRIHFEDLIYDYEDTKKKLIKFLNFESKKHINKFKKFNPEISIKNTRLFDNEKYFHESKIIEEKLREFLYFD